jgi:L-fucose mutarotase/ribose pyranase (RbsD/FucU family)
MQETMTAAFPMIASVATAAPDWKTQLSSILPLYGHRNWIVVADSAYPEQSKAGIETIVSGADQLHAVRHVLDAITACAHVHANVYVDKELAFVSEVDAPGISDYRRNLAAPLRTLTHGPRGGFFPVGVGWYRITFTPGPDCGLTSKESATHP